MSGPQPKQIEITKRQQKELERIIAKPSSKQAAVLRAKMILMAADGYNNQQIANRLEGHRETVRKWRRRWAAMLPNLAAAEAKMDDKEFNSFILACLQDQVRSGSPGKFSAEQICQIIALACEPPEEYGRPVTHWTPKELAAEAIKQGIVASISARHAGRFLKRSRSEAASVALLAAE